MKTRKDRAGTGRRSCQAQTAQDSCSWGAGWTPSPSSPEGSNPACALTSDIQPPECARTDFTRGSHTARGTLPRQLQDPVTPSLGAFPACSHLGLGSVPRWQMSGFGQGSVCVHVCRRVHICVKWGSFEHAINGTNINDQTCFFSDFTFTTAFTI